MASLVAAIDHLPMGIVVVLLPLGLLALAGTVAAITKAAAPEISTGRRIELSILAGLLAIVMLFLGLVGYWMWQFTNSFTF